MTAQEVACCLKEETSVESIEAENTELGHPPFGHCADLWQKLKSQIQPGDKIHKFCTDADSWRWLEGRAGVALVRSGTPVYFFCTVIS